MPTWFSCFMSRSASGSPSISRSPFEETVLIGTIRIPNPAARMIAEDGELSLMWEVAFFVNVYDLVNSPSSTRVVRHLLTAPSE